MPSHSSDRFPKVSTNKDFDLFDLFAFIWRNRAVIAGSSMLGLLLGLGCMFGYLKYKQADATTSFSASYDLSDLDRDTAARVNARIKKALTETDFSQALKQRLEALAGQSTQTSPLPGMSFTIQEDSFTLNIPNESHLAHDKVESAFKNALQDELIKANSAHIQRYNSISKKIQDTYAAQSSILYNIFQTASFKGDQALDLLKTVFSREKEYSSLLDDRAIYTLLSTRTPEERQRLAPLVEQYFLTKEELEKLVVLKTSIFGNKYNYIPTEYIEAAVTQLPVKLGLKKVAMSGIIGLMLGLIAGILVSTIREFIQNNKTRFEGFLTNQHNAS